MPKNSTFQFSNKPFKCQELEPFPKSTWCYQIFFKTNKTTLNNSFFFITEPEPPYERPSNRQQPHHLISPKRPRPIHSRQVTASRQPVHSPKTQPPPQPPPATTTQRPCHRTRAATPLSRLFPKIHANQAAAQHAAKQAPPEAAQVS